MKAKRSATNTSTSWQILSVALVASALVLFCIALTSSGILENDDDGVHVRILNQAEKQRQKKITRLVTWAIANGAIVSPSASIQFQEGAGWGFVAHHALKKDEIVCSIPSKMLVYPQSKEGSAVFNLASILLRSRRSPFSASLPWHQNFTRKLEFDRDIENARQASDEEWDQTDYRTAVLLVTTRVHHVGNSRELALVPLCDMFNTDPGKSKVNVDCSSSTDRSLFECRSIRHVEHDEPLLVSYRYQHGEIVGLEDLKKQWFID